MEFEVEESELEPELEPEPEPGCPLPDCPPCIWPPKPVPFEPPGMPPPLDPPGICMDPEPPGPICVVVCCVESDPETAFMIAAPPMPPARPHNSETPTTRPMNLRFSRLGSGAPYAWGFGALGVLGIALNVWRGRVWRGGVLRGGNRGSGGCAGIRLGSRRRVLLRRLALHGIRSGGRIAGVIEVFGVGIRGGIRGPRRRRIHGVAGVRVADVISGVVCGTVGGILMGEWGAGSIE